MVIKLEEIMKAKDVLQGVIKNTNLFYSQTFSEICDNEIYFKPENLQKTGSFKIRGAYNKIANLTEQETENGVIAASAGNHAQGVAFAATFYGIKSVIVMPKNAPIAKITATRNYGAEVILHGENYDEAYEKALRIQKKNDLVFVHPFNDPDVIAGQGTIALEIFEDLSEIDYILAPIGGGGLISGLAVAAKTIKPEIKIIGTETENFAAMKKSLNENKITTTKTGNTLADGMAVKKPGTLTFKICQQYLDDILIVKEEEIANAILMLMERSKLITEGAGATTLAALLNEKLNVKNKVIVPVLSGGNIDVNLISRIINQGLNKAGRRISINTIIEDKPGNLQKLLKVIADLDANIISINHDHSHPEIAINFALVELELEIRNKEHGKEICKTLIEKGYDVK